MRYVLHQVRTPLAQIIGYSEMLQDDARSEGREEMAEDLAQIRESAQQLLDFLESVFRPDASNGPTVEPGDGSGSDAGAVSRAAAKHTTPTASADPGAAGAILVVDDEARNRELLARRLTRLGYDVAAAADGREALLAIESGDFDLVLLDVLMEGMSGMEALEAIRRTHSSSELPVIMATALGGSDDVVQALRIGANDYVTKPYDFPVLHARVATQLTLRRAAREVASLAQQLEIRNAFIRRTFGRYVSDEVVTSLLDDPAGLELRGEKRRLTIMMADLRGFSQLADRMTPSDVVSLLNRYLGSMAEVIQSHGGTIDEFQGDGILAFFGAPVAREDDAKRAVVAAVAMQRALGEVNESNRASGLPPIEMGVGIATGEAIVGNLGSESRAKYGAVGSTVNLAGRIESYSLGGDVLVDDATRATVGEAARFGTTREVWPKGFAERIRIHHVTGAGDVALPEEDGALRSLRKPLPLRYAHVQGKDVGEDRHAGAFIALSATGARLRSELPLPELSNLRLELLDDRGEPLPGSFYAKVVAEDLGLVRFTTRSPALETALDRLLGDTDD